MAKPQQVVITIGHLSLLLPDDSGVSTVLKTLTKGVPCYYYQGSKRVQLTDDDCQVSMSYLPQNCQFVDENDKPVLATPRTKKGRPALPTPSLLTLMEGRNSRHG